MRMAMRGITWLVHVFLSSRSGSGKRWHVMQYWRANASALARSTGSAVWPSANHPSQARAAGSTIRCWSRAGTPPLSPLGQRQGKLLEFWDDCFFLEIRHKKSFAFLDDRVALGLELFANGLDAAGILRVDLSVALERAPIRRDVFAALLGHLVGGMGGDPREDAGGDRAGEVGLVFFDNAARSLLMVVSLLLGTFFINASTSSGAGMTNRPCPNFLENLPSPLSSYLGKSLESLSLATQLMLIRLSAMTVKTSRIEAKTN